MDTISLPYPADSILRPQLYGGGGGGNSCRERGEAFEAALSEVWGGFFLAKLHIHLELKGMENNRWTIFHFHSV